jgi:hypothetical protein
MGIFDGHAPKLAGSTRNVAQFQLRFNHMRGIDG